jgi:hypothetical protein
MTWKKLRAHRYVNGGEITLVREVYRAPDGRKVPIPWRPGPDCLPVVGTRAGWHIRGRKMGRDAWIRANVRGDDDPHKWPAIENARWIPGWRPHLYRVDELRETVQKDLDAFVCFPEGEKDADTLAALGYCAVASAGGANADPDYDELQPLFGRHVVLFGDNDEAGRRRVRRLSFLLFPVCESVRVVEFPDLPDGGDVSDFIEAVAEVTQ